MIAKSLYESDIPAWAEEQATAVRRLGRTRPDLANAIDWGNIAEELDTLGRSEVDAVESLLRNILVHIVKGYCDGQSFSARAWATEVAAWQDTLAHRFRPSMRDKLDLDDLWRRAARLAVDECRLYGVTIPPGLPSTCPFDLDEILSSNFSFASALSHLHGDTTRSKS